MTKFYTDSTGQKQLVKPSFVHEREKWIWENQDVLKAVTDGLISCEKNETTFLDMSLLDWNDQVFNEDE